MNVSPIRIISLCASRNLCGLHWCLNSLEQYIRQIQYIQKELNPPGVTETSVNFLTSSRIISLIYNALQPSSLSSPPLHSQIPLPRSQPRAVVPVLSVMLRAYPGLLPTTLFIHQRCSPIPFQLSAREEAQSPAQQVSASPGFSSQLLGSVSTG